MKSIFSLRYLFAISAFLLISCVIATAHVPGDKMRPEELVEKHLASIGSAEALSSNKSIVAVGTARAVTISNVVKNLGGPAQIASEGDKILLALLFNSANYPYEKVGYNGDDIAIALLPEGKRTVFLDFLKSNDVILKQGLFCGTLSTAWPLRNLASRNPKLSYAGTDKINNRLVHELKYLPKKGAEGLQITLFFDAETFQHVRTEYRRSIPARMGLTADQSASQTESRYKLVEDFSDFKREGDLTLPHTYKLRYTIEEQSSRMFEWAVEFSQFAFNQSVDVKAFSVGTL